MNTLELLNTYPKAATVVKQWFLDKMLESLKDDTLPEDFKEYVRQQGIDSNKIAKIVGDNPRSLFDVFDNNKIYIKIDIFVSKDESAKFNWSVNTIGGESAFYSSRRDAEKDAVTKAFEMLNNKL
jgi:hypothetical protein